MLLINKAQKLLHNAFSNLPSSISLNARLQFLTLMAILPLWGAVIFTAIDQRNSEIKNTQTQTSVLTNILANEYYSFMENGRQLAMALAIDPALNQGNEKECAKFLNILMKESTNYLHFLVIDQTGKIVCAATDFEKPMHFSDHDFFLKNLAQKPYPWIQNKTRINYELNKKAGNTFINFSAPIFNKDGSLDRITVAVADFSFINQLLNGLDIANGELFVIFNDNGVILGRHPNPEKWIGRAFKQNSKLTSIMKKETGANYFTGIDGIERFYTVKKISNDPAIYITVGASKQSIFSDANRIFQRNIILAIIVTIIALVAAKWIGRILFYERTIAMQELDNLKTDFISLTSHQLRTPLTSIRWFTELLLLEEAGKISPNQKEFLEEVKNATNSLIGLVNKLLNVSRARGSRLKVSPQPTDLLRLSQEIIKELEPQLIEKSLKFNIHFPKSLPKISVDPIFIRQILLNILSNALKYTAKNNSVSFSVQHRPKDIYFSISDTGIGIPKEEQKYVFERFFRGSNAQKKDTEGVGVGLFLVKHLVKLSGGSIGFSSKENKGSAFWFTLPLTGSHKIEGETTLTV